MDDLTEDILGSLTDEMTAEERQQKITELRDQYANEASEDGKYEAVVKSFYGGNEYFLFVYETYRDVRLVGAPPESIGKYGGDTDNWMWSRHTGDFSIFRVYTAPDGSPAEYAEENIPLKPKHYLPISLKGYQKDDYAMIWGYPGGTERYLTSYGIDFATDDKNPALINTFGKALEVMKSYMDADPEVRIELASDYAGLANSWKYFIGQSRGLKNLDVKGKKEVIEKDFTKWVNSSQKNKDEYGEVLENIQKGYDMMDDNVTPFYYFAIGMGNLAISANMRMRQLSGLLEDKKDNKAAIKETTASLKENAEAFFEDYDDAMDRDIFKGLLKMYKKDLPPDQLPDVFTTIDKKYKGDTDKYVDDIFDNSLFTDSKRMMKFLDNPSKKKLDKAPLYQAVRSIRNNMVGYYSSFNEGQALVDDNMRLFIAGLREMNPQIKYYPDANSSMRFSYGTIQDYYPADAIHYDYVTNLAGIMEKEDPSNPEFVVPEKLKELYEMKDFGPYGVDGKMITCFLSTNDITGGNSGSPVMNGNGELIGLAFDGNWEAMSGDIAFEPELQRTINVDIRYVLFIIDKFAGAQNLIDELTIVR